jgi:uncharacterized protein YcbX
MSASIAAIHRYPIKGLSPQRLQRTALKRGQTLAADRRYAIENGPSGFDPAQPRYFPKTRFLMLMRTERLAAFQTEYDDASHILTIAQDGAEQVRGDLSTPEGRAAIEHWLAREFAGALRGPPRVLQSDGHSFSDVSAKVVSIVNLASVAALARIAGAELDPLRFRANLHVEGWPEWHENGLVDQTLTVGAARLKVVKQIVRCAAINVAPRTGARDHDLLPTMTEALGHRHCGVYAEVIGDGDNAEGDEIAPQAPMMM